VSEDAVRDAVENGVESAHDAAGTAGVVRARAGDGIEILRLNRPAKRNALDSATLHELLAALDAAATDPNTKAVVLSTTSTTAFCAGADVSEELDTDGGQQRMAAFCRLYAAVEACPVVTIAVCVGNCVGAGAEIAAGCDLRVGGDNLKLAWAGARLGVPVGPARLGPLIGVSRAKELIFTGRVVGMTEAAEIGFLHRSAAADDAERVAVQLAETIAAQSATGIRQLKQMFRDLDASAQRVAHENELLMQFQRHGSGIPARPAG
jgi:enoyl-CoA hydratase/carnithine racemase